MRQPLQVFLSYRRDDTSGHAGRLYDLLAARYGAERVFMDIDTIPPGSEFGEAIDRAVASCDVLIALIGRNWLEAGDATGRRRLDDHDDFVRREIESALAQGVVVVPACVQGARVPQAEDLPPTLAPLARRQGFELSDSGWRDDVARMITRLEGVTADATDRPAPAQRAARPRPRPSGRGFAAAGVGILALLAALGALVLGGDGDEPNESPDTSSAGSQSSGLSQTRGTVTLGSDLRIAPSGERWYCTGSGATSPPCTYVLTRLPEVDRPVKAPFDGVVTRWRVRGAGGPMRLIVVRGEMQPGGRSNLARVQGSAEQEVTSRAPQQFDTRLPISREEAVGVQFSTGAFGDAPYSQGTWLEIWIPPLGPEPRSSIEDTAHDYELLYNADIERDRDGDRFGDVTQDDCPDDPRRQEGC